MEASKTAVIFIFLQLFNVAVSYNNRIIVVEDAKACFRRALAGKRVIGAFVKRALTCERIEDCQHECSEERRFFCEGFNYRLDESGRGNGDCELLDIPLVKLDLHRETYNDRNYDVYERDRNGPPNCKSYRQPGPDPYDRYPPPLPPPRNFYDNRRNDYEPPYHDRRYYYDWKHGDGYYNSDRPDSGDKYLPKPYHRPSSYLPSHSTPSDRQYWDHHKGLDWGGHGTYGKPNSYHYNRRNHYVPPRIGGQSNWGTYGGVYGLPSPYETPITEMPKIPDNAGYPKSMPGDTGYNYAPPVPDIPNKISESYFPPVGDDALEHKTGYNFLKDECSLRTATGFRLHKHIITKTFPVENIHECEMLCFSEGDQCQSFSFRYTLTPATPSDNCFMSSKNYKQLDFYTDLEPNRDYDIYVMNNRKRCTEPIPKDQQPSDCFWHTQSGFRLHHKVVRDSINVVSIVECQLECLAASRFLCRGFSFRHGPLIIGADNCLLTDWPSNELDQRSQLVPEPEFVMYERGSYGHGCEPNHFSIRGKDEPVIGAKTDQLCYIGYGSPAKLLPQAIRKSIFVNSELDCKAECTKTRFNTLLHCMSFSFRTNVERGETNCDLSDVMQRDLLQGIDYISDHTSWLFAWDNYNPECVGISPVHPSGHDYLLGREGGNDLERYDPRTALDTWRVFSVSGWPCKRGTLCRRNKEAGFWYCHLEGGDADTWDYCCRPDHQCGYSAGFHYQWCYVGPDRTQWRKCSDRYFPYIFNQIDRHDLKPRPYIPDYTPAVNNDPPIIDGRPPLRTPIRRIPPPRRPSLDEYEKKFSSQFLDPPKPGGFGQPRLWPVSYLHREAPPNETAQMYVPSLNNKPVSGKHAAIKNLIEVIKSNDINNIQYEISNKSRNRSDDILLVKIPLPTNFTEETNTEEGLSTPIDLQVEESVKKNGGVKINVRGPDVTKEGISDNSEKKDISARRAPTYRRSFVERTNVTNYGRRVYHV